MNSTDTLITKAEIKTVRANAKTITLEMVLRGHIVKVNPLILASGYKVSMTVNDVVRRGTLLHALKSMVSDTSAPHGVL